LLHTPGSRKTSRARGQANNRASNESRQKKMFRVSRTALVRLPKARRPRERAWEVLNLKNYGYKEGSQNYRSWIFFAGLIGSILCYEIYRQWLRYVERGDTCEACDAARRQYRARAAHADGVQA
jgi:hypothetical protein